MKYSINEHQAQLQRNNLLDFCLGSVITDFLKQEKVKEIMVNPDGKLWIESVNQGKFVTEHTFNPNETQRIISIAASINKKHIDSINPVVSVSLEKYKARFQGWLPPVSAHPAFCIRKQIQIPLTLEEWVTHGSITERQKELLINIVLEKKNLIICGGTGSGKTTFTNTLLQLLKNTHERIILIEDTPELYLNAEDHVSLLASPQFTMRECIAGTLRMRPDRIIIGEVRDGAALDLLKSWNTGHGGGIATLHANSTRGAIRRLEDLVHEVSSHAIQSLITEVVHTIAFLKRTSSGIPKLMELSELYSYENEQYMLRNYDIKNNKKDYS